MKPVGSCLVKLLLFLFSSSYCKLYPSLLICCVVCIYLFYRSRLAVVVVVVFDGGVGGCRLFRALFFAFFLQLVSC